jgi:hypothetical protein
VRKIISGNILQVPEASMINENILRLSDVSNKGIRENTFTGIHAEAVKRFQHTMKET